MFGTLKSRSSHQRSQSTPYFQNAEGFTDFKDIESGFESYISASSSSYEAGVTSLPTAPAARPRNHARTLTSTSPSRRPPLITTHIQVESKPAIPPAAVSTSLFSNPGHIHFDLSPPGSPPLIPSEEKDRWSAFIPNLKPKKANEVRPERSPSPLRISTWFQGESAPVNISVLPSPVKEAMDPLQSPSESSRPAIVRRKSVTPSVKSQRPGGPASSILSFFTSRSSPTCTQLPPDALNDEFATLDIKKALQPHGATDPFSPSSFKNLQQNAEGTLARMQTRYKQQLMALKEISAEQEVQDEELEEAQTRAHHLKNQLNDVSGRLDEREKEMQRLLEELEEEKRLRKEAERSTIRVVGENCSPSRGRRRGRTSLGSIASTPSMMSDADSNPSDSSETLYEHTPNTPSPYSTTVPRSNVWRENESYQDGLPSLPCKGCGNHGIGARPALGGNLAGETVALKARVRHLEKELDGCLDLLRGIGLS